MIKDKTKKNHFNFLNYIIRVAMEEFQAIFGKPLKFIYSFIFFKNSKIFNFLYHINYFLQLPLTFYITLITFLHFFFLAFHTKNLELLYTLYYIKSSITSYCYFFYKKNHNSNVYQIKRTRNLNNPTALSYDCETGSIVKRNH